ncbi:SMP-30/gluconolactonase/LRE family protein [Hymenobacter sp. BT188]|uniref:SMP-30/gluconolactonase/LRE family protein n=1 Tax=Hymenobacter sp. BT188 TaxID=2763504 RepID=UPI0016519119|nr:SMP-30/gluconolactonase/LRE family protein [Hymenobacter sp. BT188]MBC6608440.1 SMP-30/gluconolactonase/LRE family protein [Hymenobacter sp. BT188]
MDQPFLLCLLGVASLMLAHVAPARAQRTPPVYPTLGSIIRDQPAIDQLVAPDAKIEVLASGFTWPEGPVWSKQEGALLFSHAPQNVIYRWKEGEPLAEHLKPAGYTGLGTYSKESGSNGLAFDKQGQLVACEHGDRRISVLLKDGGKRTLADSYEGKRLNSPNDLVIKSNGDIYFTDPPYGLPEQEKDPRRELDFSGVYRVAKSGQVTLVIQDLTRPNGVAFSPDEKTLYVTQSDPKRAVVIAYPVRADGSLGKGRVFFDATPLTKELKGMPDGIKVDQQGNVFTTGPGGVHVLAPDGTHLGRIGLPVAVANLAWGDDGSTLYLTASNYLCRIRTKTKGAGW